LSQVSDLALPLLDERTAATDQSFFVYQDGDSAYNHGFPSGFFGVTTNLTLNASALFSPSSPTGTTTDPAQVDRAGGTVLSLTFAPESPGEFTGLNFEEPQDYGTILTGRGYDLTGATEVDFDAFTPTPGGITVQFGVDGHVTSFMHIAQSSTFNPIAIPLASLGLSNISDVHDLFSVATNDLNAPGGGILLLDNIRFNPVPTSQAGVLGLPLSTQTFGVAPLQEPASGPVPFPPDQVLKNLTTIYEAATTLLALLGPGASADDLAEAREIADAFVYALGHDNHGDSLPRAPDGTAGLHNGYFGGDITLFNSQQPPALGQEGDVRLAGFSASSTITPSGFLLVDDGATGGNNAFAILALVAAYRQFQDPSDLAAAAEIGHWIVGNLMDTTGTGYGGFYTGYPDMGAAKTLETGKSTENNADIFAAFTALAAAEAGLGNSSLASYWTTKANVAGDFVIAMYDPTKNRFNAGTAPSGTTGSGISLTGPQKGADVINTFDFLDSDSFTTLALAASPRYRNQINWQQTVQYVINNFAQTITAAGKTYQGFDIVTAPTGGPNGIAWEFTAQSVELMRFVDALYSSDQFESTANLYMDQIQQAQTSAPFGDGAGLVGATVQGGDTLPPIQQGLITPFQDIPERTTLAATTWAIFADQGINPLLSVNLSVKAGTPQSATVGATFAIPLQAVVAEFGNPTSGASVTFSAPAGGAGGTFAGGLTSVVVTTDANGVATAPNFMANSIVGSYTVTATVAGAHASVAFSLNNTAAPAAELQFAAATFRVNVTAGSAQIELARAGNLSASVTVVVSSPGGPDVATFQQLVTFGPNTTTASITIPIQNDERPGSADASIPLALASASDGAALGARSTATLIVHDDNPFPPLVTITSFHLPKMRVNPGTSKKPRKVLETVIQLDFSGALNGAKKLAAYHLRSGRTRKRVLIFDRTVPLASALYDPAALSVTLIARSKLNLSRPERLTVISSLFTDTFGRPLNGGKNYVFTFSNQGVTPA
jgi:hypothetical protein